MKPVLKSEKTSILVVDDETGILKIASMLVGELGWEIVTAGSGFAAIDILSKRSFDILGAGTMVPI